MFTGIIETIGTVKATKKVGGDVKITINAPDFSSRAVNLGDSIAINGVCLTVVEHNGADFAFDVSLESINHSLIWAMAGWGESKLGNGLIANHAFRWSLGVGSC